MRVYNVIMRTFLVLVSLLSAGSTLPVSDDYNNIEFFNPYRDIETFKTDEYHERSLRAGPSDIIYYFFSKSNINNGFQVRTTSVASLANSAFNTGKDTLFVVHGWMNTNESTINTEIRKDILRRHDINVFIVDWSVFAGTNYITAQSSVSRVGEYISEFVIALQQKYGLNLNKVRFVGHSLGAHVCGNAGSALHGQLNGITGLDPAGPMFTFVNEKNRLDPSDAQYVEVIHSNMGMLGISWNLGHADYYPNGGRSQPGCGLDLKGSCAHGRSFHYYSESLNNDRFLARKCDNYNNYQEGKCNLASLAHMGRFEIDTQAQGEYYLKTNDQPPYAKG